MNEAAYNAGKIVWDEEHVKTLLFEPENLVSEESWNTWVKKQGGLAAVRETLRSLTLSDKHRKTLQVVLAEPGASLQRYALLMHTSVATFVRYRAALVKMLTAMLNSQEFGQPTHNGAVRAKNSLQIPNNLPQRSIALIGRENELNTIQNILRQPEVGLLTISGPGGIGKTRLALQSACELLPQFEDGVFFVSLANITNPELVAPTIVQTLGLPGADNFPASELLKNHLHDKQTLLVLDNFEQITPAAVLLDELLKAAPGLKLIVTSRAVLHVYGEYEFIVPPLMVPDLNRLPELQKLAKFPAVALFLTRAQAVKNDFALTAENAPVLAEICVRLDGIPLALELAAARCKLFAPQALLRELNQRFTVLEYKSIDREPRHQTLRNAIDWSYQLLGPAEQSLFLQLGVFVGGCTLEAVEAVCELGQNPQPGIQEHLASLVDKSMLQHEIRPNGEPRFSLLESLREYALEQLDHAGQSQAVFRRHLAYILQMVEVSEPGAREPNLPAWMNRLEEEHDNLRAALQRALDFQEYETALRIAGAVWRFWQIHGHVDEGARWMQAILASGSEHHDSLARAKALWGAGWLEMVLGNLKQARDYFEEGSRLSRQLNNPRYLGLSLHGIGAVARGQGEFDHSQKAFAESLPLFQSLGNMEDVAWTFEHLGATALDQGEFAQAAAYLEQGLALFRSLNQEWPCAEALTFLGHAALQQANYILARKYYEEARAIYLQLDDHANIATLNICIGAALHGQGSREHALNLYKENLVALFNLKSYWGLVWAIERLAEIATKKVAAHLYGAAAALRQTTGVLWHPGFHSQYNNRRFEAIKNELGDEQWQQAWTEGQAMSLDEAVSCALGV